MTLKWYKGFLMLLLLFSFPRMLRKSWVVAPTWAWHHGFWSAAPACATGCHARWSSSAGTTASSCCRWVPAERECGITLHPVAYWSTQVCEKPVGGLWYALCMHFFTQSCPWQPLDQWLKTQLKHSHVLLFPCSVCHKHGFFVVFV